MSTPAPTRPLQPTCFESHEEVLVHAAHVIEVGEDDLQVRWCEYIRVLLHRVTVDVQDDTERLDVAATATPTKCYATPTKHHVTPTKRHATPTNRHMQTYEIKPNPTSPQPHLAIPTPTRVDPPQPVLTTPTQSKVH